MAKFYSETIQQGSSGDSVREWQNFLRSQGYNIDVDGIYGNKTRVATVYYQRANGLTADGIVGDNTWSKAGYTNINTPVSAPNGVTFNDTNYIDTKAGKDEWSDKTNAENAVNNYGKFEWQNEEQAKELYDKIMNRPDFTYDFNADALYQQYKDKYIQQGKLAMADTIGQASAMTGGYGNSYAQSVGQQAYQASLENLNDIVPELYQMAYDRYQQEGQDMYNQYALMMDDHDRAYGMWTDGYDRLVNERTYESNDYYSKENSYNANRDTENALTQQEYENAWTETEWDEYERQQALAMLQNQQGDNVIVDNNSISNPNDKKVTPTGGEYDNGSLSTAQVKELQNVLGVEADGMYGEASKKAAGGLSAEEAYKKFVGKAQTATRGYDDFSEEEYHKNATENGGSYYKSALADLKEFKARGASKGEVSAYLNELVGYSYITRNEYMTLYNKYRDNRL